MRGRPPFPGSRPSEREHDAVLALVDAAPEDNRETSSEPVVIPPPRLGVRLRMAGPTRGESAGAGLAATLLTALFVFGAGLSISSSMRWSDWAATAPGSEAERIVYWTPQNPEDPETDVPDPTEPVVRGRPMEPAPSTAASPVPVPAVRDTLPGGATSPDARDSNSGLLRPIVPGGTLPPASRLGGAAASAAVRHAPTGCVAPCREAASAGIAPGLEMARRDSILQAKTAEVVQRAGPAQKPPGFQIGLPGGGPTKEERQRDSTLHAQYRARLQALMQRYDSAKADSIARGLIKPLE